MSIVKMLQIFFLVTRFIKPGTDLLPSHHHDGKDPHS